MIRSISGADAAAQWAHLWTRTSFLMADAAMVLAMRSWRMMLGGPGSVREGERMLSEKVEAGFELAGALASGRVKTPEAAARKAVSVYGKRIRANRKRLG
jgi:hypothetical protein